MTLIVGTRCSDGVILSADRRRLARYEKGPDTKKIFKLDCGVLLAGAGDDAVLNEAQVFIERRVEEVRSKSPKLFDIAEITAGIVNELVGLYRDKVEESFGFVLAGLEDMTGGKAKLYTVFGAGLSDVPLACIGSGSSYARPLFDLLLAGNNLDTQDAARVMPALYTLVSRVQTSVGGGVDICIVKDEEGAGNIQHQNDVDVEPIRLAVLETLGIQSVPPK
jgi:20S proteasome alpha/beta subunit